MYYNSFEVKNPNEHKGNDLYEMVKANKIETNKHYTIIRDENLIEMENFLPMCVDREMKYSIKLIKG
jgi:hypothetical protein